MRSLALLYVLVLSFVTPSPAAAQLPELPKPAATAEPAAPPAPAASEAEAPDSPRAAARAFLELTTKQLDNAAAARYLVLPPGEEARGPELARRMRAVLERHLDIDLDALSPEPHGSLQDGLPEGVDRVGQLPDAGGGQVPVFVVRTGGTRDPRWAFSRQTVSRIDGWYDALPDRWIRDRLPQTLQRYGPWRLMWWQWLALPVLAAVALVVGRLFGSLTTRVLHRVFRRTPTDWDERLLTQTSPALTLLWTVAVATLLLPRLGLRPGAHATVRGVLGGLATLGAFWVLWRAVDVWAEFLNERPWAKDNPQARSLLSVTRNLGRVLVAVAGLVATLGALGYPVATVLAGLGIGGIAIAFGAQKTIENLFGSLALAADQPFRVGDFVKIEDFSGNVERIGMRSTQIRTLDRTLVSIPNGKLADLRIEDFAARDRIRFATTVGLLHGTSEQQVRQVVGEIERLLRGLPLAWPDVVVSRLAAFSPSSLDVEVLCWFVTSDFEEYRRLREEALLGILRIVEGAGTAIAPPTVQLAARRRPSAAAGRPPQARE